MLKARVYRAMEPGVRDTRISRLIDHVVVGLIMASVFILILDSVDEIHAKAGHFLYILDWVFVAMFTIEYTIRIWSCTADPRYRHPVMGRIKYLLTPMAMVDLIAILPSFIPGGEAFRVLRMLRLVKLTKYSKGLDMVIRVLHDVWNDLLATAFVTLVMLMITSTLMYYAEHDAQSGVFKSIPHTMWWSIVTLTTVGYGDMYPVTPWGKILGSAILFIGVGMVALPTGIIGAGFVEEARKRRRQALGLTEDPNEEPEPDPGKTKPPTNPEEPMENYSG